MNTFTPKEAWDKAKELAAQGEVLELTFDTPQEAREFQSRMGAARARNAREMSLLFMPEIKAGKVIESEWAGLETIRAGAKMRVGRGVGQPRAWRAVKREDV